MNMKKISTTAFIAGAVALAISGAAAKHADAESVDKEKCFGVVKAGNNDCAAKDGTHSCMGQAEVDGAGGEWIALPKGFCEKLVSGSLTPYEGTELPAADEEAEAEEG